jgi:hypothetical protein
LALVKVPKPLVMKSFLASARAIAIFDFVKAGQGRVSAIGTADARIIYDLVRIVAR